MARHDRLTIVITKNHVFFNSFELYTQNPWMLLEALRLAGVSTAAILRQIIHEKVLPTKNSKKPLSESLNDHQSNQPITAYDHRAIQSI